MHDIRSDDPEVNLINTYYVLAKSCGFTPKEVDELDVVIMEGFITLNNEEARMTRKAMKNA